MNRKLIIPFGEYQIAAQIDASNVPDIPPELFVWVQDKNGNFVQDICLVRQNLTYDKETYTNKISDDAVQCLVWGNPNDESFTNDFTMGIRAEEEE